MEEMFTALFAILWFECQHGKNRQRLLNQSFVEPINKTTSFKKVTKTVNIVSNYNKMKISLLKLYE